MRRSEIESRLYDGLYLPTSRSNEGLAADEAYVLSAMELVDEVRRYREISATSRVLDFGCGQGRFAIGLLKYAMEFGSYCGIDTDAGSIRWCNRWLASNQQKFSFLHVPARNARYNQDANPRQTLPVERDHFDIAFLNSVFSHMLVPDVLFYLTQLHQALLPRGIVYSTAFVEEDVPNVDENPSGYLGRESRGPLHRVRYERSFFLSLFERTGFRIVDFQHQQIERTKQSVIVAEKNAVRK